MILILKTMKKLTSMYTAALRSDIENTILRLENMLKDEQNFTADALEEVRNELPILKAFQAQFL